MRILIADDEKEPVDIIKKRLGRYNDVDVAYDGAKALELIKSNKYEIVFVDHNMPELTGLELIEFIKEKCPDTKTVMITGYPHMPNFAAKEIGADEYLNKPCRIEDIEHIIEKYRI
jgi:YesN/AraC family two-component response regulator